MWVKVCGITNPEDAWICVQEGVDALGFNLIDTSRRRVTRKVAKGLVAEVGRHIECVALVANWSVAEIRELVTELGVHRVQLHGSEGPEIVEALGTLAFQAIGISSPDDVARAAGWPGERLVVDACHGGRSGGTGVTFDWSLLGDLSCKRRLILAGGLHPENVAEAIELVMPFGVDVASGVEVKGEPRRKDPSLVRSFVSRARGG